MARVGKREVPTHEFSFAPSFALRASEGKSEGILR